MLTAVAAVEAGLLGALSLLHIYWALGGRGGSIEALPSRDGQPLFQPGPLLTLAVAALLRRQRSW